MRITQKVALTILYGRQFALYVERVHRLTRIVKEIAQAYEQPKERVRRIH